MDVLNTLILIHLNNQFHETKQLTDLIWSTWPIMSDSAWQCRSLVQKRTIKHFVFFKKYHYLSRSIYSSSKALVNIDPNECLLSTHQLYSMLNVYALQLVGSGNFGGPWGPLWLVWAQKRVWVFFRDTLETEHLF